MSVGFVVIWYHKNWPPARRLFPYCEVKHGINVWERIYETEQIRIVEFKHKLSAREVAGMMEEQGGAQVEALDAVPGRIGRKMQGEGRIRVATIHANIRRKWKTWAKSLGFEVSG